MYGRISNGRQSQCVGVGAIYRMGVIVKVQRGNGESEKVTVTLRLRVAKIVKMCVSECKSK